MQEPFKLKIGDHCAMSCIALMIFNNWEFASDAFMNEDVAKVCTIWQNIVIPLAKE